MVGGSFPLTRKPLLIGVTVTGTFSSLIFTVMLGKRAVLEVRNENSDFGATVTLFLSMEKGGGVKAEKMTLAQASTPLLMFGLASYAQTWPTVPHTPAATISRRRFCRLTIMPLL